jgi:hypothetical protein
MSVETRICWSYAFARREVEYGRHINSGLPALSKHDPLYSLWPCNMHISHFLDVAVLLSLAKSVSSSPIAQGATPNCATGDIAVVKRTVNEPAYFCAWWSSESVRHRHHDLDGLLILSRARTTSPFLELTAPKVNNACKCIVVSSKTTSKNKRAASPSSAESCMAELSMQFTQPYGFCNFYNAVYVSKYSPEWTQH